MGHVNGLHHAHDVVASYYLPIAFIFLHCCKRNVAGEEGYHVYRQNTTRFYNNSVILGCRHSSVDLSAPSILPRWVRLPSMPSTLFSFMVKFFLYLSVQCEKRMKINKKEAGFGPFKKQCNKTKV